MVKQLILLLALLPAITACAVQPEIVEVRTPVHIRPAPPAELLGPVSGPGQVFVDGATGPELADGGVNRLVEYISALRTRVGAWETWAR